MSDQVTILLATYNGGKYIAHQLDSVLNQTYSNWHLMIRDDGSTDNTVSVIEEYKKKHLEKIILIQKEGTEKGSVANFSALLQAAPNADYILFCDQDDEWKPDKIEVTLAKMKELETIHGKGQPVMVFTNFQYVDEDMNIIESKKNFQINTIPHFGFAQLLAQNPVYGCTSVINRALADKIISIPTQAENHDHWIALVASAFGTLYYLNKKTVLYRQHGKNISGSHDNNSFRKRIRRILLQKKNYTDIVARREMMCVFKERYYADLSPALQATLDSFLRLYNHKNIGLLLKNIHNKIRCQTTLQTFLFYTTLFFSTFDSMHLCEAESNIPARNHS